MESGLQEQQQQPKAVQVQQSRIEDDEVMSEAEIELEMTP